MYSGLGCSEARLVVGWIHLLAPGGVVREYGDVDPWCGVPVGEVIPFLRALVTVPVTVRVLSSVDR